MNPVWVKYLNERTDVCWFCGKSGCDEFDTEFDTFLHLDCLRAELDKCDAEPEYESEARMMRYLIGEESR